MPKLEISGSVKFYVKNLRAGNEITSTMRSGELIVSGFATPFVLRRSTEGELKRVMSESLTHFSVICYEKTKETAFTKRGYVNILISSSQMTMWVYIKKEFLKKFFSAVCMASI
jgi:hypothetical protein